MIQNSVCGRNEQEDRLSSLPNDMIGKILSLLQTKEAARTSILSKEWRNQWNNIEDIRFDREGISEGQGSMEFMDKVFLAIGDRRLRSFLWTSSSRFQATEQPEWFFTILRRDLEELKLFLPATLTLSPSFSLSSKLTTLFLGYVEIIATEPSPSSFVLHCPSLKSLTLCDCMWRDLNDITINTPLLKTLCVVYIGSHESTYLRSGGSEHRKFTVKAPNLKDFTYLGGGFAEEFFLSDPSSVSLTSMRFNNLWRPSPVGRSSGFALLKRFSNLTHLILGVHRKCEMTMLLQDLPVFSKVVLIELDFGLSFQEPLTKVLESAPKLQSLVINSLIEDSSIHLPVFALNQADVPTCMTSHLSYVAIRNFYSDHSDLSRVKYILEASRVLKRMVLFPSTRTEGAISEDTKKQVHSFPKASPNVSIVFGDYIPDCMPRAQKLEIIQTHF